MSRGVNKVILLGNIGQPPDIRQTNSGASVANLSLATNVKWYDKETKQSTDKVEWHNLVFFGKLAEVVEKYLSQGDKIYVEGSLSTTKYEKDGITKWSTKVIVRELVMLSDKQATDDAGYADDVEYTKVPKTKTKTELNKEVEDPISF